MKAALLASLALLGCHSSTAMTAPSPSTIDWTDAPAPTPPDYYNSLSHCWTDATCPRAMLVSHGGDWDVKAPYDSHTALVRAVQRGS
ncbi:MAG TPA: hypothetical protein VF334_11755, partial [Polyangia bacterium]